MWRSFEKKSYRIGPSLPRSSSHALVLEGVTLDPPQLKAQPGLAPSYKGMVARLGKPIDVTFPSKALIYMRCFFILHSSMINPHFREMSYMLLKPLRSTSNNSCAVPKKPGYFLYMGSLVHLNKASQALNKCAFGGPWKSLTPLVYKFHHFSRVYPHPKGVPPFFTMVATTSRSSRS